MLHIFLCKYIVKVRWGYAQWVTHTKCFQAGTIAIELSLGIALIPWSQHYLNGSDALEYTLTSHVVNAWISRLIVIIWGSETFGLWETQLQFFYFYFFQTSGYQRSLLSSGTTFFPEFLYVFSRRKQRIKLVFATSLVIKQILSLPSFFFSDRMFIVPKLKVLKVVFFFFK